MNELYSQEEGLERNIEVTKQHYFALHADIRTEFLDLSDQHDQIQHRISFSDEAREFQVELPKDITEKNRKPASRDMKETYRRICNLCHPDKTKKNDPTLIRLMQEAREALRSNDEFLLNSLYDQVLFYNNNPAQYEIVNTIANDTLERRNNPWFKVFEYHEQGKLREAYIESRKLLGQLLADKRIAVYNLRHQAAVMGIKL